MYKDGRLTKKEWKDFYKKAFGISKVEFRERAVEVCSGVQGCLTYDSWVLDRRIYTQVFIENECINSIWFNKETYEYDMEYQDKQRDEERKELFKEWESNYENKSLI